MDAAFLVQHSYEVDGEEAYKMIGVYRSEDAARRAVARLLSQPGFKEYPEGFSVERYPLDNDHWVEGFLLE
jgi:hypothetical protein